jgi:hypothetical protein
MTLRVCRQAGATEAASLATKDSSSTLRQAVSTPSGMSEEGQLTNMRVTVDVGKLELEMHQTVDQVGFSVSGLHFRCGSRDNNDLWKITTI